MRERPRYLAPAPRILAIPQRHLLGPVIRVREHRTPHAFDPAVVDVLVRGRGVVRARHEGARGVDLDVLPLRALSFDLGLAAQVKHLFHAQRVQRREARGRDFGGVCATEYQVASDRLLLVSRGWVAADVSEVGYACYIYEWRRG